MKKILLIIASLFILWLQTNAIEVVDQSTKKVVYFNLYKDIYNPWNLYIDWNYIVYETNYKLSNLLNFLWTKKEFVSRKSKLETALKMWDFSDYDGEIYILDNLNQYNEEWLSKIIPIRFDTKEVDKPYIVRINKNKFNVWVNYLVQCLSTSKMRLNMSNKPWDIPFKYSYCSKPKTVYYINWKILNTQEDYKKELSEYNSIKDSKYNDFVLFLEKRLDSKWFDWEAYINDITNITKEYLKKEIWNKILDPSRRKHVLFEVYNYLINEKNLLQFYKQKPLYWLVSKEDIQKIVNKVWNDYFEELDQQYYNKINQKEQYKQEAIWNYAQLKQEYENYKKLTAENREKAIKLTEVLTKIVSKYNTKQEKLAVLDKVDEIIATKYNPDKFKNQDLIWYVKDYLKIIRLAIELSE